MPSSSRIAAAAIAGLLVSSGAWAQSVTLEFSEGQVNLSARNATPRAILAEWARLGGTTIVGADRMVGGPITLELSGVTERQALDILLRDVPGYMLAARRDVSAGVSRFDRILVMPTTATPGPAPPATFSSAPPPFAPGNALDQDAAADEAARREELLQRQREAAEAARRLADQIRNGVVTSGGTVRPSTPPPFSAAEPAARETPPPGPTPGNPFMPTPGSPTPGTIAPVPQQQQQSPNPPRPVQ
jgi:hypothetical protein